MIVGKIENGLDRGFVKHRLNCLLIADPISFQASLREKKIWIPFTEFTGRPSSKSFVMHIYAHKPRNLSVTITVRCIIGKL